MLKNEYGIVTVSRSWRVEEEKPIGYSRMYYVMGGDVVYYDKALTTKLKSGSLYIFPSNLPYKMVNNVDDPLRCVYLHMDFFPIVTNELIELQVEEGSLLKALLDAITASLEAKNIQILTMLADALEEFLKTEGILTYADASIINMLHFISKHYQEPLSVADLSSRYGYNAQYFIRLFKKSVGVTPYQYLKDFRMKKACEYLAMGSSVSETAALVGYKDSKTFSNAFREKMGFPPGQVRQRTETL